MRWSVVLGVVGLALLACAEPEQVQVTDRLNQMIPLIEQGLPVLGIAHPPYAARRRRGGRGQAVGEAPGTPPPEPDISEAARELVAYQLGDYELNTYSPNSVDRYREFIRAIVAAGGSARTHPFVAKIPIMHRDPTGTTQRLIDQLNDGQVAVVMQQVETVEEVNQAIAAMRFTSKGGVRPEKGFERAAAYWGMTEVEYLDKADVWPLNPNGELLINVIIESREGVANARAISAVPGVAVVTVGSGTLAGCSRAGMRRVRECVTRRASTPLSRRSLQHVRNSTSPAGTRQTTLPRSRRSWRMAGTFSSCSVATRTRSTRC